MGRWTITGTQLKVLTQTARISVLNIQIDRPSSGVPRGGGLEGSTPPPPRNSEDIGGVLDRMSKKSRCLDFLLQFTVFSYGCNLLNKGFF